MTPLKAFAFRQLLAITTLLNLAVIGVQAAEADPPVQKADDLLAPEPKAFDNWRLSVNLPALAKQQDVLPGGRVKDEVVVSSPESDGKPGSHKPIVKLSRIRIAEQALAESSVRWKPQIDPPKENVFTATTRLLFGTESPEPLRLQWDLVDEATIKKLEDGLRTSGAVKDKASYEITAAQPAWYRFGRLVPFVTGVEPVHPPREDAFAFDPTIESVFESATIEITQHETPDPKDELRVRVHDVRITDFDKTAHGSICVTNLSSDPSRAVDSSTTAVVQIPSLHVVRLSIAVPKEKFLIVRSASWNRDPKSTESELVIIGSRVLSP